jgi:uncharacterized protein (TIGR00299 family) protein
MGKTLFFQCQSGISGDMTIGALLDLGIDTQEFESQLALLPLEGYNIEIGKRDINGIQATDFHVHIDDSGHEHRNLSDIINIISSSGLSRVVQNLSTEIFRTIAEAEARVHGKPVDEIHFHEVGAVDSIVDIVGAAVCVELLKVSAVMSSPLPMGSGHTRCAHGIIPVPAPATVEILKGVPVYSAGIEGELVTPTGAAIIRQLADEFGPMPAMKLEKVGYGAGKKTFSIPNILRVFLGETTKEQIDELVLLETNIDDLNPETYSYLIPLLLERGARDAYLTHLIMKKGRPAVMLSVLCGKNDTRRMEDLIFRETTTLGIRRQTVQRRSLDRRSLSLDTRWGKVKVKAAYLDGRLLRFSPEYEECRRLAGQMGLPLKAVYDGLQEDLAAHRKGAESAEGD